MIEDERDALLKLIETLKALDEPDEKLEEEIQSLQMNIIVGEQLNDYSN